MVNLDKMGQKHQLGTTSDAAGGADKDTSQQQEQSRGWWWQQWWQGREQAGGKPVADHRGMLKAKTSFKMELPLHVAAQVGSRGVMRSGGSGPPTGGVPLQPLPAERAA